MQKMTVFVVRTVKTTTKMHVLYSHICSLFVCKSKALDFLLHTYHSLKLEHYSQRPVERGSTTQHTNSTRAGALFDVARVCVSKAVCFVRTRLHYFKYMSKSNPETHTESSNELNARHVSKKSRRCVLFEDSSNEIQHPYTAKHSRPHTRAHTLAFAIYALYKTLRAD